MNNLFREISVHHQDKIHEHIQESLLLGKRPKANLAWCFHSFLQVWKGALRRKYFISTGRNGRLKLGKLLNLIGRTRNKTNKIAFNIITMIFREDNFFKRQPLFDSPGTYQSSFYSNPLTKHLIDPEDALIDPVYLPETRLGLSVQV